MLGIQSTDKAEQNDRFIPRSAHCVSGRFYQVDSAVLGAQSTL
jgi:hypothetical protein